MASKHPTVATGVVHEVPMDLRKALTSDPDALARWNALTPIARNEWICWPGCQHRQERGMAHKRSKETRAWR